MTSKKNIKVDFEKSLKELEAIVNTMEQGNQDTQALSLEKSLELFTKGVTLVNNCQETLKNAEQQIKVLT